MCSVVLFHQSRSGAFFNYMATETEAKTNETLVKRLFEAGAHFGFSKSRRHPTVAPYLFGTKNGTDIFDLEKTTALLDDAKEYIKRLGSEGKIVVFVGTKEEISRLVQDTAERLTLPYVINRWIGGTFTNFSEIKKRVDRLVTLRSQGESGELEKKYTKKERLMLSREVEKLNTNFGGIVSMERLPAAVVVVDPRHEAITVKEAQDLRIPVIAVASSDCDISKVSKPIVVNDSHTNSVAFVLGELAVAYEEGKANYTPKAKQETK